MTPSTDLAGIAAALGDDVGRVSCPHMAMVLDSPQELHPALAAFYSLGASRNGWMLHRSLPGQGAADRAGLVAAGLDVEALEAENRFTLSEVPVTEPPATWAQPFLPLIETALRDGYEAVWWSRFPVGPAAASSTWRWSTTARGTRRCTGAAPCRCACTSSGRSAAMQPRSGSRRSTTACSARPRRADVHPLALAAQRRSRRRTSG